MTVRKRKAVSKSRKKLPKGPGYHAIFYGVGVTYRLPKERAITAKEICGQLHEHGLAGSFITDGRVVVLP